MHLQGSCILAAYIYFLGRGHYSFTLKGLFLGGSFMSLGHYNQTLIMLLLGFKFVASSIPLISLAGVAIGVGLIFACLVLSICRNPVNNILDQLIR